MSRGTQRFLRKFSLGKTFPLISRNLLKFHKLPRDLTPKLAPLQEITNFMLIIEFYCFQRHLRTENNLWLMWKVFRSFVYRWSTPVWHSSQQNQPSHHKRRTPLDDLLFEQEFTSLLLFFLHSMPLERILDYVKAHISRETSQPTTRKYFAL